MQCRDGTREPRHHRRRPGRPRHRLRRPPCGPSADRVGGRRYRGRIVAALLRQPDAVLPRQALGAARPAVPRRRRPLPVTGRGRRLSPRLCGRPCSRPRRRHPLPAPRADRLRCERARLHRDDRHRGDGDRRCRGRRDGWLRPAPPPRADRPVGLRRDRAARGRLPRPRPVRTNAGGGCRWWELRHPDRRRARDRRAGQRRHPLPTTVDAATPARPGPALVAHSHRPGRRAARAADARTHRAGPRRRPLPGRAGHRQPRPPRDCSPTSTPTASPGPTAPESTSTPWCSPPGTARIWTTSPAPARSTPTAPRCTAQVSPLRCPDWGTSGWSSNAPSPPPPCVVSPATPGTSCADFNLYPGADPPAASPESGSCLRGRRSNRPRTRVTDANNLTPRGRSSI